MDAEWAALNAAQQAALIAWIPLASLIMYRTAIRTLRHGWSILMIFTMLLIVAFGGVALIIMALGGIPQ